MNCEYGDTTLDDYFDHQLNAVRQAAFLAHCRRCALCRAAVDQHTQYLLRLKQFKLAAPVAAVGSQPGDALPGYIGKRKLHGSGTAHFWMRAAAAIGACAIGLGWFYSGPEDAAPADPGDIWSKVNIVIQVPADLRDAKLTVSLPRGVYVQGQDRMQTLAWNTDFVEGTNALELPIFVDGQLFDRSMPQYLDATLEYQGASKTFEFLVGVETPDTVTL